MHHVRSTSCGRVAGEVGGALILLMMMSIGRAITADQVGIFTPKRVQKECLSAGEVGFLVAGVKDIDGIIGTGPEGAGIAGDFSDNFGVTLRFQAQTGVGASSSSSGIGIAAMAIERGYADVVIIPTASGGAITPGSRTGGGPAPSSFEHI